MAASRRRWRIVPIPAIVCRQPRRSGYFSIGSVVELLLPKLGLVFARQFAIHFFRGPEGMRRSRPSAQSPVTPEMRERQRAITTARWADPIAGAKLRAAIRNPASRAKVSEATKARWADPAAREKMIAEMRAAHTDPDMRQKKSVYDQGSVGRPFDARKDNCGHEDYHEAPQE
jgi:hypothetical protein